MNGPTIAGTTRAKDTPIPTAGMPSAPPLPPGPGGSAAPAAVAAHPPARP